MRADASQFAALARGLQAASITSSSVAVPAMRGFAKVVETAWKSNATATAGSHGVHYPNAITSEVRVSGFQVVAEVGPDSSRPQGGMGPGFEFGSRNQPPHLDGIRAIDTTSEAGANALEAAVYRVIP